MSHFQSFAERHPVLAYLLLCFGITWTVWFCVPLIAGSDWALGKIVTGLGFGPALAAIILDRARGTAGEVGNRRWWTAFTVVFLIVGAIDISTLITGDGITAQAFSTAEAPGLTPVGVLSALAAAAIAGFIFASLANSRSPRLASILRGRAGFWWLAALCLPAIWMLTGFVLARAMGAAVDSVTGGLPATTWALYVLRSILFTLLVVATGEEAGWRGWMLPALQQRYSPLLSSVLLGIVWGLWHFPLYLNGQYHDAPTMVFAKVGACVLIAIPFTWLYNRTAGNLLLAVVLHTAFNNTPRIIPTTEQMGPVMLAVFVAMILYDRMWRRLQPAA